MKKKLRSESKKFIPVSKPFVTKLDSDNVYKVLKKGWISSEGPEVKKFEEKFAKLVKRKFAVSVSSGTAALEVAIKALGIKKK